MAFASLRYRSAKLNVIGVEPKGLKCKLKNLVCWLLRLRSWSGDAWLVIPTEEPRLLLRVRVFSVGLCWLRWTVWRRNYEETREKKGNSVFQGQRRFCDTYSWHFVRIKFKGYSIWKKCVCCGAKHFSWGVLAVLTLIGGFRWQRLLLHIQTCLAGHDYHECQNIWLHVEKRDTCGRNA